MWILLCVATIGYAVGGLISPTRGAFGLLVFGAFGWVGWRAARVRAVIGDEAIDVVNVLRRRRWPYTEIDGVDLRWRGGWCVVLQTPRGDVWVEATRRIDPLRGPGMGRWSPAPEPGAPPVDAPPAVLNAFQELRRRWAKELS
jgi:hypothetical protein